MLRTRSCLSVAIGSVAIVLLAFAPASAHEKRTIAGLNVELGWATEPPATGSINSITLAVDKGGKPVEGAVLQVIPSFGAKTGEPLDLEASDETPGIYTTAIVPTRSGTYSFKVTGKAAGKTIDATFTTGKLLEDVVDTSSLGFPEKDPTATQLSDRVARADDRATAARSSASTTRTLAIVALVLAVLAGGAGARRRASKG